MPDTSPEATDASPFESFSDPETLREHEDVPYTEKTRIRDDRDHCATDIEGRAIVGVTDDAGDVLLAVHEEAPVASLPHAAVESGDDWVAVARDAVETVTGVPFDIDGVEIVREIDHVVEGEDEPQVTTHNVLFRASLAGDRARADDPSLDENDHWDADWFGEVPDEAAEAGDFVADDVGQFVG
ncbi:hypothetical protein [Halorussus litoreus]|uniref:hypothetical protein n=1 Tax=Halorussus litoreus TaxID=1710536 RepID=UPI000E268516|nr:hypothetical protein [Halorussus litoreus]